MNAGQPLQGALWEIMLCDKHEKRKRKKYVCILQPCTCSNQHSVETFGYNRLHQDCRTVNMTNPIMSSEKKERILVQNLCVEYGKNTRKMLQLSNQSKQLIWFDDTLQRDVEPTSWLITAFITWELRWMQFKAAKQVFELWTRNRLPC